MNTYPILTSNSTTWPFRKKKILKLWCSVWYIFVPGLEDVQFDFVCFLFPSAKHGSCLCLFGSCFCLCNSENLLTLTVFLTELIVTNSTPLYSPVLLHVLSHPQRVTVITCFLWDVMSLITSSQTACAAPCRTMWRKNCKQCQKSERLDPGPCNLCSSLGLGGKIITDL